MHTIELLLQIVSKHLGFFVENIADELNLGFCQGSGSIVFTSLYVIFAVVSNIGLQLLMVQLVLKIVIHNRVSRCFFNDVSHEVFLTGDLDVRHHVSYSRTLYRGCDRLLYRLLNSTMLVDSFSIVP